MSDYKFTDAEIVKALECCNDCNCKQCPCYVEDINGCKEIPTDQILALINRQKTEIENLREIVFLDRSEAIEAERRKIKAEAIKEFAERLIDKCTDPHWCVWMSEIEDLVKEMTEK